MKGKKGPPRLDQPRDFRSPVKRGKATWKRTNEVEWERDLNFMLDRLCMKQTAVDALEELNTLREAEGYKRAIDAGEPEHVALASGKKARLSYNTIMADLKKARAMLAASRLAKGETLILQQVEDLEMSRKGFELAQRKAWEQHHAAAKAGDADPRWLAIIDRLAWKEVLLSEKLFQLRAMLGLADANDLAQKAAAGDDAAARALRAHEIAILYSPEGRAAGLEAGESNARLQLIGGMLDPGEGGGGGGKGAGLTAKVVFEVRSLPAEEG